MARTSSIILSKEDKKAKLAELTASIKEAKSDIKAFVLNKKEEDKTLALVTKEHAAQIKANDKEIAAAEKRLALLEAQKLALANNPTPFKAPEVVPSIPTQAPIKRTRRTKAEMEAARAAAV